MAKILDFRNKKNASSDQAFLADEQQTLSFQTNEDGEISLGGFSQPAFSNPQPDPKKDWSNQELADLFRVRQLLSKANVPVETDRGVTDEGDPWFVFCHANGDVFIHLCRIDGLYFLDSPNVLRPLRGANFGELIADFTNQALPEQQSQDGIERRIIRLERGGKVRLHPSAMLAALIWTLFLASEELVLFAPEDADNEDGVSFDFGGMFEVSSSNNADPELLLEIEPLDIIDASDLAFLDDGHGHAMSEDHLQSRDGHHHQGLSLSTNGFAIGLSTIAIAMGFMSETVLLENQRQVLKNLEMLELLDQHDTTHKTATLDVDAQEVPDGLIEMLAEFVGVELGQDNDISGAHANSRAVQSSEQQNPSVLDHLLDNFKEASSGAERASPPRKNEASSDPSSQAVDITAVSSEKQASPDENMNQATSALETEQTDEAPSSLLANTILAQKFEMEKIQFEQESVWISSNLNKNEAFDLFEWIEAPTNIDSQSTQLHDFDAITQRVLEFMQSKSGDFGIMELRNGGIVFIDKQAVAQGDYEYVQWEADNGKIVSLIGVQDDIRDVDMIA
ncbi:hypothetical protein [Marivita geojedonensis]|uniref:Uncharacterized protein n=1 Tax=Marivita geojedonensis TaxID=1123756 RepID=A0A1X4NEC5_9RHOB|nr:hypothetical protein [Marivita geojedonensis]OSQ45281.1 hypothetical protein MGEO_18360 [Marivita geojedonensis]PRY73908.1 hypothetical protein CLV76_12629 [Marivita geojedonensis]